MFFLQTFIGHDVDESLWQAASLPVRHGRLGLPALELTADAAYIASKAMTAGRVRSVYPRRPEGQEADGLWDAAMQHVGGQVSVTAVSMDLTVEDKALTRQKALTAKITEGRS